MCAVVIIMRFMIKSGQQDLEPRCSLSIPAESDGLVRMAVSNSSTGTTMIKQSDNEKTVTPELASVGERILRWKSREALSEENLGTQQENGIADRLSSKATTPQQECGQAGQAGPRTVSPPRLSYARQESPLRRAESVRRRASIDFDALQKKPDYSSEERLDSGTSVPSFHELLNQGILAGRRSQSPGGIGAVDGEVSPSSSTHSGATLGEEMKNKNVTKPSTKPDEPSQISKGRKFLECRSSVKPPLAADSEAKHRRGTGDTFQHRKSVGHDSTAILPQPKISEITTPPEIKADTSGSYDHVDITDMAKEMATVYAAKSSAHSLRNSNRSSNGYENFSPKSEKIKKHFRHGAGESSSMRSSPKVLEFSGMPPMFEAFQGSASPGVKENGHQSPQIRARNAFLERLHTERSAQGRSDGTTLQLPNGESSNINGRIRRGEPLSQSARFANKQTLDHDFVSARASHVRTASSFPYQSMKKVLVDSTRTSGVSVSCRQLSTDVDDVLDSSRSNLVSLGCKPSPLRPRATSSENKVSSMNVEGEESYPDQRVPKSGPITSSHSKALVVSKPKQTPRALSPATSFKKWVASQFHFGGGKKSKGGLDKPSPPSFENPDHHLRYQLPSNGATKALTWKVNSTLHLEYELGSVPRYTNAAEFAAHPLPEPPEDSTENGTDSLAFQRSRQTSDCEQSLDNSATEGFRRQDKVNSHRLAHDPNTRSPMNPSGPLKFQGLQHLFTSDVSSSPKPQSSPEKGVERDFDGKSRRSRKFLECAEIEDLNIFLRAKRDSYTFCQKNGSGYLKFIATVHPSDLGSMISAICYSYLLEKRRNGPGRWSVVPLINFSRWKMQDHLDAAWLFNVCGLDVKALMFINEVDFEALSQAGVTTRTMVVGQQVLRRTEEVASCCTLLAETFLRDENELWTRSGSFLKTLLLAGMLMDTANLSKPSSSAMSSRDHQMLLNLATGAGPLGRFGLYERMRTVHSDPDVLKLARKYYGTADEQSTEAFPCALPPPPLRTRKPDGAKLLSPKGSPLFSSEAEDNCRSSGSPTSRSSSSERSRANSPATILPKSQLRSLSSLSRLPSGADERDFGLRIPTSRNSGLAY